MEIRTLNSNHIKLVSNVETISEQFLLRYEYLGQAKLVALVMSSSGVSQLSLVFLWSPKEHVDKNHQFNTSSCFFLAITLPFSPII